MALPLSILDLAPVRRGQTVAESLGGCVTLAREAERLGYRRVWYAEHHNMASIASSATSVLIAHVAAHTGTIRVGAGGIMLPNHSPLVIAEQFGTLEALHPGRIDLGLGRAPGSDQQTTLALRRSGAAADRFPEDVVELQCFLSGKSCRPGVQATPGAGSNVPLYILGSSMFGATLAAALGLPYAFASHFAPELLVPAVQAYRREFRPSGQLEEPYVIAGVNVVAADESDDAERQFRAAMRQRAAALLGRGRELSDAELDALLASPAGSHVRAMARYSAVGEPAEVRDYLLGFAESAGADELITVHHAPTASERLRSVELLAASLPQDLTARASDDSTSLAGDSEPSRSIAASA